MTLLEQYYNFRKKKAPHYAKHPLWLLLWKPFRKFINVVIIPNIPFNVLRITLYRIIGFHIGKNCFIGMKCYLDDLKPSNTIIENDVTISYGCYFSLHGNNQSCKKIVIQDNVYIGMRVNISAIKENICLGKNSMIGAASFVKNSIPADSTAVGVPARVVKKQESPQEEPFI